MIPARERERLEALSWFIQSVSIHLEDLEPDLEFRTSAKRTQYRKATRALKRIYIPLGSIVIDIEERGSKVTKRHLNTLQNGLEKLEAARTDLRSARQNTGVKFASKGDRETYATQIDNITRALKSLRKIQRAAEKAY